MKRGEKRYILVYRFKDGGGQFFGGRWHSREQAVAILLRGSVKLKPLYMVVVTKK